MVGRLMIVGGLVISLATPVIAAEKECHNLRKREKHQQERIDKGIKDGSLTADEVSTLQKEQTRIREREAQLMKDGKLTKEECQELEKALTQAGKHIQKERKNPERQ